MRKFIINLPAYLPSVVVTLVQFYLTLVPQPLPPIDMPFLHIDKLVHVAMMLGVYLVYAFDYTRRERQHMLSLSVILWILLITVALGGFIELAQGLEFINRGCDFWDFVADFVGALIAFAIVRPLMRVIFS